MTATTDQQAKRARSGRLLTAIPLLLPLLAPTPSAAQDFLHYGEQVAEQAQQRVPAVGSDWERPSLSCEPACRSGFECRRGECAPVCHPTCEPGSVCSEHGCVRAEPPPAEHSWQAPAAVSGCEPTCRTGYTCRHDRCVSLCNPLCAADQVCTAQGECTAPPLISASSQTPLRQDAPAPAPKRDDNADSLVNLHADAAGLFQCGLTPTLEIGQTVAGFVRLRIVNTGLASYFLLERDRDDVLRLGLGGALGVHFFSAERGNMRGLFGGVAVEYAFVETRDTSVDFALYRSHVLIPELDLGYRWSFGGLLVGLSGRLGLAIPLSLQAVPIGSAGCRNADSCAVAQSLALIPGLAVDLGWFIGR